MKQLHHKQLTSTKDTTNNEGLEDKHFGLGIQIYIYMSISMFHSNIDSREYRINYSFNCNSSNVVYLLECTVCDVQYVGSTCTPFRLRFNDYKACSRKFNLGASVPQVEFFRHFTEEGHHVFLKDISVKVIDRLTGGNRMREIFWQYRLDCFAPKGLNTRQVDT